MATTVTEPGAACCGSSEEACPSLGTRRCPWLPEEMLLEVGLEGREEGKSKA